jgi:hypothetical protein
MRSMFSGLVNSRPPWPAPSTLINVASAPASQPGTNALSGNRTITEARQRTQSERPVGDVNPPEIRHGATPPSCQHRTCSEGQRLRLLGQSIHLHAMEVSLGRRKTQNSAGAGTGSRTGFQDARGVSPARHAVTCEGVHLKQTGQTGYAIGELWTGTTFPRAPGCSGRPVGLLVEWQSRDCTTVHGRTGLLKPGPVGLLAEWRPSLPQGTVSKRGGRASPTVVPTARSLRTHQVPPAPSACPSANSPAETEPSPNLRPQIWCILEVTIFEKFRRPDRILACPRIL